MSSGLTFVKSTEHDGVTPQTLYIDAGAAGSIAEVLKERGSKRILILSNKATLEYRSVEAVIKTYNNAGLRTFKYQRHNIVADVYDIESALSTYNEYNCDTLVVIGNRQDITVGKMVAVAAKNPGKVTELSGIGKVKYDIGLLVVIMVDNTPSASTPECAFFDNETKTWHTVISQIILPQIVVIDSDMMMRNKTDIVGFSALNSLCMAIEAYLSPWADRYPEYRADAEVAIYKILGRLDSLVADNLDGYLQTKISTGGFYAGLSTTKLGFGYTYFMMHKMQERLGCEYGTAMGKILVAILKELLEFNAEDMARISRSQHFSTSSLDTLSAAQTFIESVSDIYKKNSPNEPFLNISPDDCVKIADDTRKALSELGFTPRISADRLVSILRTI